MTSRRTLARLEEFKTGTGRYAGNSAAQPVSPMRAVGGISEAAELLLDLPTSALAAWLAANPVHGKRALVEIEEATCALEQLKQAIERLVKKHQAGKDHSSPA